MILEKNNVEKCAEISKVYLTEQEVAAYDTQLQDLFK